MEHCEMGGNHCLISLKCGHIFGEKCIEKWLKDGNGSCPTCRENASKNDCRKIFMNKISILENEKENELRILLEIAEKKNSFLIQENLLLKKELKIKENKISELNKAVLMWFHKRFEENTRTYGDPKE